MTCQSNDSLQKHIEAFNANSQYAEIHFQTVKVFLFIFALTATFNLDS